MCIVETELYTRTTDKGVIIDDVRVCRTNISGLLQYTVYISPRPILVVASKFLIVLLLTSKSAIMPCPCGLSQDRVVDLDKRDRVPLIGGKCQNPLADGSDGICGKALGAHPLEQGNYISV